MRFVIVTIVLASAPAYAFPELAVRAGVDRCSACHISPAGGGLLNDFGRVEAAETLSAGGDGRLLGFADTPMWLLAGGDLRAAALAYEDRNATDRTQLAAFPMQADLRAGVTGGGFTLAVTAGLRGSTRLYSKSQSSYVESSEHYLMWESSGGIYVRAGRFFPVQGLRLPDHTLYVRRYTGTDLFEEPYAVAAGYVDDRWELHTTGFVHDPVLDVGRREAGGAVHAAIHDDHWEVAASGRVGKGDDGTRVISGVSARAGVPVIVFLGEVDAIRDQVAGSEVVMQLAGFVGANTRIVRGISVLVWGEEFQERLGYLAAAHHGAGLSVLVYPRAHWEIIAETRWQKIGEHQLVGLEMLQLHYYL